MEKPLFTSSGGIRYRLFSLVVFVLLPAEVAYAVCVVHIESVNTSTTVANTTEAIQYHFLNFFIFSAYFFGRRSLFFSESPESFLLPLSVLSLHKYPDHEAALLSRCQHGNLIFSNTNDQINLTGFNNLNIFVLCQTQSLNESGRFLLKDLLFWYPAIHFVVKYVIARTKMKISRTPNNCIKLSKPEVFICNKIIL